MYSECNFKEKRLTMNGLNFKLYENPLPDPKKASVQFQVGKGKKNQPSIYVEMTAFDCIRGVIWNKHREFSHQKTINHISNEDWVRCLQGFKDAVSSLESCEDSNHLTKILSTPNHLLSQKARMFEQKHDIQQFLKGIILWVKTHLKKEKYILIIQHDANN